MNKVVCYVCGTSYPENAPQCPICGYVQTAEKSAAANSGESTYTYVKGGRFSKANVKKRNQAKQAVKKPATVNKNAQPKPKEKSNVGTIILITVLLLAILAVVGYIALRFFLPNDFIFEGLGNLKLPSASQENQEYIPEETKAPITDTSTVPDDTAVSMECTAVQLDRETIQLNGVDDSYALVVTLEPVETLDLLAFSSSDESVATVSESGTITAVGNGTAIITVTCGSVTAECTVICAIETDEEFVLNRKEITLNTEGQTWLLYDGTIPAEEIVWSSDDNNVATVEDGKVTAISNGDTTIYGIYGDQTVECVIHCNFDEEPEEGTGSISEADGNSDRVYTLHNPHGYADDVTINPGEKFTLMLVDEDKQEVTDAQWAVLNSNVCTFSDNTVTGVGSGYSEVTATYEGKTYTCVVRVN